MIYIKRNRLGTFLNDIIILGVVCIQLWGIVVWQRLLYEQLTEPEKLLVVGMPIIILLSYLIVSRDYKLDGRGLE